SKRPFIQFRVTGYFTPGEQSLAVVAGGKRTELRLPHGNVAPGWIPITIPAPDGPFVIEATPTRRELWWGFTAPAEVGPLTGRAEQLLALRRPIFFCGAALWLFALLFGAAGLW